MSTSNNLSNITFNGAPLTDVVAEEASSEMHKALSTAIPRISRRSGGSKHKAFTNGISRNLNLPEPEPDFTKYILMRGEQYLYEAKRPFGRSEYGIKAECYGAQFYDPDSDKVQCLECGDWFIHYGAHCNSKIGHPSARQYKIRHGLCLKTGLCGLRYRDAQRQAAKQLIATGKIKAFTAQSGRGGKRGSRSTPNLSEEVRNVDSHCRKQIPARLKLLSEQIGRTPSVADIAAVGIKMGVIRSLFGSVGKCMRLAGVKPRHAGEQIAKRGRMWTNSELIDRLVTYHRIYGNWPTQKKMRKPLLPSYPSYHAAFGGLPQAIARAAKKMDPLRQECYALAYPEEGHLQTSTENGKGRETHSEASA